MTPSPQQQTILDFVRNDPRSLIVEARAGSGKTSTLVMIAQELPPARSSLFLAFNKNIATELQSRLPTHVQSKTFHSHCFGMLQRALPKRPRVDQWKVSNILKEDLNHKDLEIYGKFVERLVSHAKGCGIGTEMCEDEVWVWQAIIDHHALFLGIDEGDEQEAIVIAQRVLRQSNEEITTIDFDDMLYLTLLRNVSFDKFNFVMLDEAQDTNGVQRQLTHKMLAPQCQESNSVGRLIAVGDPFQSIYGFRGADSNAMESLREEFQCETLPLSVSYRCSKKVVEEAIKILK